MRPAARTSELAALAGSLLCHQQKGRMSHDNQIILGMWVFITLLAVGTWSYRWQGDWALFEETVAGIINNPPIVGR
jgi:hypothetical protein